MGNNCCGQQQRPSAKAVNKQPPKKAGGGAAAAAARPAASPPPTAAAPPDRRGSRGSANRNAEQQPPQQQPPPSITPQPPPSPTPQRHPQQEQPQAEGDDELPVVPAVPTPVPEKLPEPPEHVDPWEGLMEVKTLTGDVILLHDISSSTTIARLKALIEVQEGFTARLMRLAYCGSELEDDLSLLQCKVPQDGLIVLLFRLDRAEVQNEQHQEEGQQREGGEDEAQEAT